MKSLVPVLSLALLWLGAADALARDLAPNYDPAAGARRNRGVVVMSLTMPVHDGDEHWDSARFTMWYQKVPGLVLRSVSVPGDTTARRNSSSEFSNVYGQLRAIELEAGDYEFSSFTYRGYDDSRFHNGNEAWDMAPLRFTVRPGVLPTSGGYISKKSSFGAKRPSTSSASSVGLDFSTRVMRTYRIPNAPLLIS